MMDSSEERSDDVRQQVAHLTEQIASLGNNEARVKLLLRRATGYEKLGDFVAAASDYVDALEWTSDKKQQVHACFMLSCIFSKKGERESALWWANEVLERDRASPEGFFAAGVALAIGQLHRRAVEKFQAVISVNEEHVQARLELGRCYRELCAFDEALDELEKLSRRFPEEPLYHYELGWTHHVNICDLERVAKALHHYDIALSLSPSLSLAERINRNRTEVIESDRNQAGEDGPAASEE